MRSSAIRPFFVPFALAALLISSLLFIAMPARASGLTEQQIQAILSLLQSFGADSTTIANTNAALHGQATSGTTPVQSSCISLSYDLSSGSTDSTTNGQVSQLQKFLGVNPTGYFGPLTENAVQQWQSSHGVVSSGSPDTTGYGFVGTHTRTAMGCSGSSYNQQILNTQTNTPIIPTPPVPISEATQNAPNTAASMKVGSVSPPYISVIYSNMPPAGVKVIGQSTIVPVWTQELTQGGNISTAVTSGSRLITLPSTIPAGYYTLQAFGSSGVVYATSLPFYFGSNQNPNTQAASIRVLSPNGGEQIAPDGTVTVQWSTSNIDVSSYVNLVLIPTSQNTSYSVASRQPATSGSYTWNVSNSKALPGRYKLLAQAFTAADNFIIEDSSDGPFMIGVPGTEPSVRITSPNGGESYVAGSGNPLTINWTANNIPADARACVTLQSVTGHFFTFPPNGGSCMSVSSGAGSVTGTLMRTSGYDLGSGSYKASVMISGQASGGKEGPPYAQDQSDQPFNLTSDSTQSIPTIPIPALTSPTTASDWVGGCANPPVYTGPDATVGKSYSYTPGVYIAGAPYPPLPAGLVANGNFVTGVPTVAGSVSVKTYSNNSCGAVLIKFNVLPATTVASPTFTATPSSGIAPLAVSFTTNVGNNYAIDFGDGSVAWIGNNPNGSVIGMCTNTSGCTYTTTHTYQSGLFTAKLISGGQTYGTQTISVTADNSSGLVLGSETSRLTEQQIQAIIALLNSFGADPSVVANVNATLHGQSTGGSYVTGSSVLGSSGAGAGCLSLTRNLYKGISDSSSGGEVSKLQQFLGVSQTGYFGPLTEGALQGWQSTHGIVSSGSANSTGYGFAGPQTRSAMRCSNNSTSVPAVNSYTYPPSTTTYTNPDTSAPSCSIVPSPNPAILGQTVILYWNSQNAVSAAWLPDTSGKDNVTVPAGTPSTSGVATVVASVLGNPSVTLKVISVNGAASTCTATFGVSQQSPTTNTNSTIHPATLDQNGQTFVSPNPTISGTAPGLNSVTVSVGANYPGGGGGSITVPVVNGSWSTSIDVAHFPTGGGLFAQSPAGDSPILLNGSYQVNLYQSPAIATINLIGNGTFTVNVPQPSLSFGPITAFVINQSATVNVAYVNAPAGSSLCLLLQRTSDGNTFTFPPQNVCSTVSGSGNAEFDGVVSSQPGYELTAGAYTLIANLSGIASGGKDAPALFSTQTGIIISDVPQAVSSLSACPANATSQRGLNGQTFSCMCPASFTIGSVWGDNSGYFTDDSDICTAGALVGQMNATSGGEVDYTIQPGQNSYAGTSSYGITSSSWGSWLGSFQITGPKG